VPFAYTLHDQKSFITFCEHNRAKKQTQKILTQKEQTMDFIRFSAFLKNSYAVIAQSGIRVCHHYGLDGVFTVFAFFIRVGLGLFWTFIFVLFWIPFFQ
jgi:hypothetical protein